jgi:hypothetical protein
MSLQNLPKAMDEGKAFEPIQVEDMSFEGEKLSDESAFKLVNQFTERAIRAINGKGLIQEWDRNDNVYRDIVAAAFWGNDKNKPRSGLSMPVVMEAIESLLPQAHMAFFSDAQPFSLDPKGKTTPEAARAQAHLVCWAIEESGFEEEIRKVLKSCFLHGTGIGKLGWETRKLKRKKYVRTATGIGFQPEDMSISHPRFEYVSLRNVLVSPYCNNQDIRTSPEVVLQKYITASELDTLRADYKNVPSREELKVALQSGSEVTENSLLGMQYFTWRENQAAQPTDQDGAADPLQQPLELLEFWNNSRVITVLQRKFVIRNEEHGMGEHGFRSASFIDVLNSFYGFGVAKLLAGEQALQQGVLNKWVDSLSLKLNPVWQRKKGGAVQAQNLEIAPGKIVNEDGELEPLQIEDISEVALTAIQASEARASRRVGSNFGPEMPTQAMRTAEGVQAFTSGVQVRLQYFIENFADLVFKPAINFFIEQCKENLQPDEVNAILSERDGQAFSGDMLSIYNGQYDVDVLTSVKLTGRRAMAQMLVPIMQMLGQPAVIQSFNTQTKKFNWPELFSQIFDVTGWPGNELVIDMTDDDKKMLMMQNPAVVKAQADQQKTAQDHQNDQDLVDRKADNQAGLTVLKSITKHHEIAASALATQATRPEKKKSE